MKRKLYFLTIFMCIFGGLNLSNLNAQTTVTIGDETNATTNAGIPFDIWASKNICQQLFTANEINHTGGTINSIAIKFKGDGSTATYDRKVAIYINNSTDFNNGDDLDYLSSGVNIPSSQVANFDGTITLVPEEWVEFVFTTPFEYTGGNIIVTMYDYSGYSSGNGYYNFYVNTVPEGRVVFINTYDGDASNFKGYSAISTIERNIIKFTIEGGTAQPQPQIIEIGAQTGSSGELPTNIYYNYSLTQQIYTKTEIGKSENGNITSIAFKDVSGYTTTRNIEIYMRNTTASSCTSSSEQMDIEERCWNGEVEFKANDWTTIKFQNPFEYEADKNIMLCVVDKTGSYSSGRKFAVYNTNDACYSFYAYNDQNPYTVNSNTYSYQSTPQKNCIKLEYEEAAPSAPILSATATSETSISLTWDAVSGATKYNVYSGEALVTSTTETSFLHESLTTGKTYCYTVKAVNEVGESPASNEACATPALPGVPTNLMISVNGTSITLEWDAVDGATTYRVYDENDNIVETSLNTYTFTGLAEDTRYCYAVSAVSPVGESDKSDCVCAKTTKAGTGGDEEKEIAGNNNEYSLFLPIYSGGANKYSMSQQYYTKDEINNAGGNITSISFCVYMANSSLTHNLEIYLNNTDEFGFESANLQAPCYKVSSSDLVFEGDVTFPMSEGWFEINLDKPFLYTGNHILVTVVDNTPSTRYGIAFKARLSAIVDSKDCAGYDDDESIIDPTTSSYTMMMPANRNDIRFKFSATAPTIEFINDGDWNTASNWNTGVVPSATDDVIINANATINDNIEVKHLSVEGGSLTIESGSLTVADIMVNNYAEDLIIKDGAQLLQGYDKVKGTFQMNINKPEEWSEWNKTGWQFIASPFTNAAVSQFTDADTYDLYKFDGRHENLTEEWRNHKDDDANFETEFVSGRGYMASYQNNTTATLSGTFNSSTSINYPVTYQDIQEGEPHWPNFHLLGNPFTFNMDLSKLNMANMATGVAVVNDEGGYDYMAETGTINVGDGFFVKSVAAEPSVSYGVPTRGSDDANVSDNISVRVSNNTSRDNVVLNFAGADKVGFPKLNAMNEDIAYLYVVDNEKRYGIFNYDKDVKEVPLSFEAQKMGNYTISVDAEGEYETIVLVDRQTGIETNMLLEDYNFTTTTSKKENTDRFIVRFTFKSDVETESERFAYQSGDELIIEAEGTVQMFDVMGRMVYNSDVKSRGERINVGQLNKAAYILRLVNGEGVKVQKVIIY